MITHVLRDINCRPNQGEIKFRKQTDDGVISVSELYLSNGGEIVRETEQHTMTEQQALTELVKLQRQIEIVKQSMLDSGNLEAAEQLANYLNDTADQLQEEIDNYEE